MVPCSPHSAGRLCPGLGDSRMADSTACRGPTVLVAALPWSVPGSPKVLAMGVSLGAKPGGVGTSPTALKEQRGGRGGSAC